MTLAGWLAALAVGLLAGGMSGLLGIGGGVVMVPFLYLLLAHPEWSGIGAAPGREAVLAHATSLFVIIPTSLRGAWLYHRARLVEWRAVWVLGAGSIVGAAATAAWADRVPGAALKLAFAAFLLATAAQLWRSRRGSVDVERRPSGRAHAVRGILGGILVGALSALLGVGGGIVAIPVLLYVLDVDVRKVAATSLAVIVLTATAGTLAYALAGAEGAPAGAVGYVYLPAALALAAGTLVSVRWGTQWNRRLPEDALRRVFAVTLAVVAVWIVVRSAGAVVR